MVRNLRTKLCCFVIFLVWSALIVDGCMVVAWSRGYCLGPSEIASFVFLVLLKDGRPSVSPRFHLFVSDFNQGHEEAVRVQEFLT